MRILRDDIDKFFEYGIDLSTRTLYMGSEDSDKDDDETGVDFEMSRQVIKGLHILDNHKADNGRAPINVIMNNPGGDATHGMAIYDAVGGCKNHVTITVYGYVMSMGSVIFQAADERIMMPNASMMIHDGHVSLGNEPPKNAKRWLAEEEKFLEKMYSIYLKRIREKHPKYKKADVRKLCTFDTILSAEEAVDLGLADKIG